jgi:hypothetical protein
MGYIEGEDRKQIVMFPDSLEDSSLVDHQISLVAFRKDTSPSAGSQRHLRLRRATEWRKNLAGCASCGNRG